MDRDRDVCAFVLDYLRDGPARLDDMIRDAQEQHGFTRMDLGRATWRLNISPQKRSQDGAVFLMCPANLVAIWWVKPPHALTHAVGGGSAA